MHKLPTGSVVRRTPRRKPPWPGEIDRGAQKTARIELCGVRWSIRAAPSEPKTAPGENCHLPAGRAQAACSTTSLACEMARRNWEFPEWRSETPQKEHDSRWGASKTKGFRIEATDKMGAAKLGILLIPLLAPDTVARSVVQLSHQAARCVVRGLRLPVQGCRSAGRRETPCGGSFAKDKFARG